MSLTSLKELVILGTLRAHPLHGYALAEALEGGVGWALGLTRPTVYATLRRFAQRAWIEGEAVRDSRFPEREVYRLTEAGEAGYQALLEKSIARLPEGTYPVAVLLAFLDELDPAPRHEALTLLLRNRKRRLTALEAFPPHDGLAGASLSLLTQQVRAEVEVLDRLLAETP